MALPAFLKKKNLSIGTGPIILDNVTIAQPADSFADLRTGVDTGVLQTTVDNLGLYIFDGEEWQTAVINPPAAYLDGIHYSTAEDALASGKSIIIQTVNNSDTTVSLVCENDIRWEIIGCALAISSIDANGNSLSFLASSGGQINLLGDTIGLINSAGDSNIEISGALVVNSGADTSGNLISASISYAENCQFFIGTAPNTGLTVFGGNTPQKCATLTNCQFFGNGATWNSAVTLISGCTLNNITFNISNYAGYSESLFTASSSTDLLTVIDSSFFPSHSPVEVFCNTDDSLPSPLSMGTVYYVVPDTSTTLRLATSYDNAKDGIYIALTTNGTGTSLTLANAQTFIEGNAQVFGSNMISGNIITNQSINGTDIALVKVTSDDLSINNTSGNGIIIKGISGGFSSSQFGMNVKNSNLGPYGAIYVDAGVNIRSYFSQIQAASLKNLTLTGGEPVTNIISCAFLTGVTNDSVLSAINCSFGYFIQNPFAQSYINSCNILGTLSISAQDATNTSITYINTSIADTFVNNSVPGQLMRMGNNSVINPEYSATLTLTDGSGAGLNFSSAYGHYSSINGQCVININIPFPSNPSSAIAQINGLPFPVLDGKEASFSITGTQTEVDFKVIALGSSLYFFTQNPYGAVQNVALAGGTFIISGVYTI